MERARSADALGNVLDAAEAASPVEAVESVTRVLGLALGATSVSFLIADLSGRGLVRLAHAPPPAGEEKSREIPLQAGERRDVEERATVLPFDGGPTEQAVRTQEVQVLAPGSGFGVPRHLDQWRVLAPVTERGEAIGVLEFLVPTEPAAAAIGEIAQLAHLLAFVVIANGRH